MDKKGNIFLIGSMGAGKTTIGRQLAKSLDLEFIDSDQEIEARTGANIPWIFDIEGEAGFRRRERAMIEELCQRQGIVLATGGGAIMDRRNRNNLISHGTVVYLHTSVGEILKRTAKSQNRPLLQTSDRCARLQELIATREPLYRKIADIIIDTDKQSIKNTVRLIINSFAPVRKTGRKPKPASRKKQARASSGGKGKKPNQHKKTGTSQGTKIKQ